MLFTYALVLFVSCKILLTLELQLYFLISTIALSLIHQATQDWKSSPVIINKIINSEIIYQSAYLIWLFYYPHNDLMHFTPIILSNLSKLYLLVNKKTQDNMAIAQELILFQIKTEVFILGCHLLILLSLDIKDLYDFLLIAIICKLKYSFYFATQKAYVELHFALDNLTKKCGGRKFYHILYLAISKFGGSYCKGRQITY